MAATQRRERGRISGHARKTDGNRRCVVTGTDDADQPITAGEDRQTHPSVQTSTGTGGETERRGNYSSPSILRPPVRQYIYIYIYVAGDVK